MGLFFSVQHYGSIMGRKIILAALLPNSGTFLQSLACSFSIQVRCIILSELIRPIFNFEVYTRLNRTTTWDIPRCFTGTTTWNIPICFTGTTTWNIPRCFTGTTTWNIPRCFTGTTKWNIPRCHIQQLGIFQDAVQQLGIFKYVLQVQQLGIFQDVLQQLGIFQDVVQQLGARQGLRPVASMRHVNFYSHTRATRCKPHTPPPPPPPTPNGPPPTPWVRR